MPKKETKILVIILLILDLAAIMVFILLFSFTKKQISDTVSKTDEIKAEITKKETLFLMKNDISYGKNYENNLYQFIIGKNDVVGLIKTIESMVASSSLKSDINSITYEQSSKLTPINSELVKISMSASGEWKNLQFFLNLLENYPLKIDIRNISFARSGDAGAKKVPVWTGNFEFTVVKLKNI